MLIDGMNEELKQRVKAILDNTEDKSDAIFQAADMIATARNESLIRELTEQNARAAADEDYRKSLGLHVLSKEEKEFYEKFKDIKQAITANQIDILPTSIVDRTLDDVKKASDVLSLIEFAPADVKKWIIASHSGAATWGEITDAITGELSSTFSALNIEQHKLSVYLIIPKAIGELALPFVDKYFTAILAEAMQDGMVKGYLLGDGKNGPIGIMKKIETFKEDGTADDKTPLTTITKFSPAGLKEVRKILTNNGKRNVSSLELICNPLDEAEFVDPALYGEVPTGGYRNISFMPINKHPEPNCPQGKGVFTIPGVYVMGATSTEMKKYDQTKAMDDADAVIGKCYANGRAVDDNCAVVFDITKLEEYVLTVTQVTAGGTLGK